MAKSKISNDMQKDEKLAKIQYENRRAVVLQIILGVTFSLLMLLAAKYYVIPDNSTPGPGDIATLTHRLAYTLRYQAISSTAIIHGIIVVGNARWATVAINPSDPSGLIHTDLPNRYLRNTVEQFILHCISQIALSTYMDHNSINYIPVFTVLFLVGRAVFWIGYSRNPMRRGFGFMLTAFPTVFTFGCLGWCLMYYGPTFGLD